MFDLATPERALVVKCKTIKRRFALSARIARLRQAALQLDGIEGNPVRVLIVSCDPHKEQAENTVQHFVRLNRHLLERVAVLELPPAGGELVCIHGNLGAIAPLLVARSPRESHN